MQATRDEATSVLIVGGGPAGLAAAIALGQRGVDSTVVEAQARGVDKACGEGLMPDALSALQALGVAFDRSSGHRVRGIRFCDARTSVEADFAQGPGLGMRRPELHRRLAARAETLGVNLRWNSRVQLLQPPAEDADSNRPGPGRARINGREIRFRWLIGADGQASWVRRWAGLDGLRSERLRFGFRRHFAMKPWSEFVEVHWARAGQIYVTPVGPDCVCLVAMSHDSRSSWPLLLGEFPELMKRLGGAEVGSQPRGALSAMRRLRHVANDRTALIGDASGSADAITGEGLAMTFQQALALADGIAAGSLKGYEQRHCDIGRKPHWMGGLMLTLDRWPALERPALRLLHSQPWIFSSLLNLHLRPAMPKGFGGRGDSVGHEDSAAVVSPQRPAGLEFGHGAAGGLVAGRR